MSYSNSFPQQRPTLNLDFANSGKLDSRISFSRADTPPTYAAPSAVHYWSNERHLSSENLITQSQFSGWTELVGPTVTAAYTNGPDGSSNTATRLQSASGADRYFYSTSTSWTSGQQYTVSCWVKSNTGVAQTFAFFMPTTAYSTANLTTHATDWTRITATFTAATSSIYCGFKLLSANTTDLSIWGFQVNTGANALDYQATSGQIHREFAPTLKSVSNAGDPRFEYDPTDGQSVGTPKGLLVESQASNLARYGSDVANWVTMSNVDVTTNAAVAPNSELEADLVVATSAASYHYVYDNAPTISSGTVYTASVYVKDAAQRYVQFIGASNVFGLGQYATFDLQTGSVDANGVTASSENVGNGWYRIQIAMTATAAGNGSAFLALANSATASRAISFTGDNYSGVLIWGFQIETGSAASSLANSGTSSSGVTRAADSCSVVDATLFSSGEHTIIWEGDLYATTVDARMANLTDGSTDNRIRLDFDDGTKARLVVEADDGLPVSVSYTTDLSVGTHKVAGTVKTNEAQLIVDGTRRQLDTSAVVPSGLDQLAIMKTFSALSSANDGSGHCKRITYYNVALSQAEAEALTSNP